MTTRKVMSCVLGDLKIANGDKIRNVLFPSGPEFPVELAHGEKDEWFGSHKHSKE